MRKLINAAVMSVLVMASFPAAAQMKIAVLDYQMALLESDVAKRHLADTDARLASQRQRVENLNSDARRLQERIQQQGQQLEQTELEKLDLELRQKAREIQMLSQQYNEAKMQSERELVESTKPKLDQAIEEIITAGAYELVLERSTVVHVVPAYDITRQVIERLNSMR